MTILSTFRFPEMQTISVPGARALAVFSAPAKSPHAQDVSREAREQNRRGPAPLRKRVRCARPFFFAMFSHGNS